MMQKRVFLLIGVLALLLTFMWPEKELSEKVQIQAKDNIQAEELVPGNSPVKVHSTITDKEIKTFRKSLPEIQEAQSEIRDNPHQTPPSLIQFAKSLGPLMEKAMKSTEDARFLLPELEECVSHSSVLVSARTLCLSRAEQLGKAHQELQSEVQGVRENSLDDALEIYRKMNSFVKKKGAP